MKKKRVSSPTQQNAQELAQNENVQQTQDDRHTVATAQLKLLGMLARLVAAKLRKK